MMCRSVCSITVDTRKSLQCKKGWLKGLKTSLIFNVLDSFQILEFSHFFLLHPSLFLSVLFICWKGKLKHPIYTIIQISHLVLGNNDSLRSSRESSYQCGTPFFNRDFNRVFLKPLLNFLGSMLQVNVLWKYNLSSQTVSLSTLENGFHSALLEIKSPSPDLKPPQTKTMSTPCLTCRGGINKVMIDVYFSHTRC